MKFGKTHHYLDMVMKRKSWNGRTRIREWLSTTQTVRFLNLAKNKMLKCTSVHFYSTLTFMLLEGVFQFQHIVLWKSC